MKLSVKDASRIMGVSPTLLRLMIQKQKLPPEVAFCFKNKNRYYYYINKKALLNYLKKGSN